MSRTIRIATLIALVAPACAAELAAQGHLQDFVVTVGMAAEEYRGGIPSVTLPVIDSVDAASAASGEVGLRGRLISNTDGPDGFRFGFNGGVRQFDAAGFKLRDYAPRVWSGMTNASFLETTPLGVLQVSGQVRGRRVEDRTPIPLFLQPGYASYEGSAQFGTRAILGVNWDLRILASRSDYHAQDIVPQLDLLDRDALGTELGASWGRAWQGGVLGMRFYGSFAERRYPKQGTLYAPDPFRRDQAYQAGARWGWRTTELGETPFSAVVRIQGTVNRSNASRLEYNALSLSADVTAPLPWDLRLSVLAVLTGKSYLTETEFARLIPGEEADNASSVYAELNRALNNAISAAVRLEWQRAETDIGDAYYERYGARILLRYRP